MTWTNNPSLKFQVFQSHQSQFMVKTSAACYVGSLLVVSLTFGLKVGLAEQTTSSGLYFNLHLNGASANKLLFLRC